MSYKISRYATRNDLDPSIAAFLRLLSLMPPLELFPPKVQRFIFALMAKLGSPRNRPKINKSNIVIPGTPGLHLETWEPPGLAPERPGILYLHGGGWVIGRPDCFDSFLSMLAARLSVKVYALNYRRAPEHIFPAAIEDAMAAWGWLTTQCHNDRQLHKHGLIVGGDSAGGNLAAVLSLQARDQKLRLPDAQLLIYPVTSTLNTSKSFQLYGQGFLLTSNMMQQFIKHYTQSHTLSDSRLSPLNHPSLFGMPPTFMALVGCDILLDAGLEFAARLRQAGTAVNVAIYPQVMHAFLNYLRFDAARLAAEDLITEFGQLLTQVSGQGSDAA